MLVSTANLHPYIKKDVPYNTIGTPYDSERYRYVPDHRALPFVPNAPSEAKKTTSINYYMNSPDAETLDMERQYIADRSAVRRWK